MVEVVLALAILSVGVLGVLGLLPNALDSSRSAADNTLAATIIHDTFNTIRSQPFAAVDLTSMGPTTPPGTFSLGILHPSVILYFDQSGQTPVTSPQDRYFKVNLVFKPDATVPVPLPVSLITATVTWPDKGTAVVPPSTNVFFTEVANYQ
jgi:uncharacterized protein (TIGR02598 family)